MVEVGRRGFFSITKTFYDRSKLFSISGVLFDDRGLFFIKAEALF